MHSTDQPRVIPLWSGSPPGSEHWTHQEQEDTFMPSRKDVRNVSQPSLVVYLPEAAVGTRAGIIICPGGGFHGLSIEHEGIEVARWLTARGVAAFVLKYRLLPTPPSDHDYAEQIQALIQADSDQRKRRLHEVTHEIAPLAIADGLQAVKLVREHAADWGIAPDRVGMVGFSAGARVTVGVATHADSDSRPDFVAAIYGALWEEVAVPVDGPPLFIALATDDELAAEPCLQLYSAWRSAGRPVELHSYAQGGHGFGMNTQGLPSDHWIEHLGDWLTWQGLLEPSQ